MHMNAANKLGALATLLADRLRDALDDLSPSAAAALLTLRYRGVMTTSELATITGIAQPTAVRIVDGLVRRGLLSRGGRSGRATPIELTPEGEQAADRAQAARLAAMQRLLDGLPDTERAGFETLLNHLLAAATSSRAGARTTCRLCDHGICNGPACPIGSRATAIEMGETPC